MKELLSHQTRITKQSSVTWCSNTVIPFLPPKPHSICFFFYHNINITENIFFRARTEKGIAWHIDASSVVWTLIDNSKLANQIARLVAIVVKNCIVALGTRISNTSSEKGVWVQ